MADSRSAGAYLYLRYNEKYSAYMDKMKMHKLMYFSQRESLMMYDRCLFDEDFYGYKYGPVLLSVEKEYASDSPYGGVNVSLQKDEKVLLDSVLDRYGSLSSWKLSSLSHAELSWRNSRKGLKPGQNGRVKFELSAMKVDAAKEKAMRKRVDA